MPISWVSLIVINIMIELDTPNIVVTYAVIGVSLND